MAPPKHAKTPRPHSGPTLQEVYGKAKVTNPRQQQLSNIIGEIGAGDFSSNNMSKNILAIRNAARQVMSLVDAEKAADLKRGKGPNGFGMLGKQDMLALVGVFGNLQVELGTELDTGKHNPRQVMDANKLLITLSNSCRSGGSRRVRILKIRGARARGTYRGSDHTG